MPLWSRLIINAFCTTSRARQSGWGGRLAGRISWSSLQRAAVGLGEGAGSQEVLVIIKFAVGLSGALAGRAGIRQARVQEGQIV